MESHLTEVFVGFLILIIVSTSAERGRHQLPCTHPLRISYPQFFTHCDSVCRYTSWSSWRKVPKSVRSVSETKCPSKKAYTEERTRTALGNGCTDPLHESQTICLPTQEERLILGLGLGGFGNNYESFEIPLSESSNANDSVLTLDKQVLTCPETNKRVCRHLSGTGKIPNKAKRNANLVQTVLHSNADPIPFDMFEHGSRLRSYTCDDQSTQHVLFVLDISNSLGKQNLNAIKATLSNLTTLFCKQVKFALITFGSRVYRESCFNCFDNTLEERAKVFQTLTNVHEGGRRKTGLAARCICEEILQTTCGIDAYPECLDVVFITDGKSKDRNLDICDEIQCLHSRLGVDTYAIGINSGSGSTPSYSLDELDCITNYGDLTSPFEFKSFDDFESTIQSVSHKLIQSGSC